MIMFCHHHEVSSFPEMQNVIVEGTPTIGFADGREAISVDTDFKPAARGAPEHPGWWWLLLVFDLESGAVIFSKWDGDAKVLKDNPWLQDPTQRAIRVAEFLASKQTK